MKKGILYLSLLLLLSACSDHQEGESPMNTGEKTEIVFIPENVQLATRAGGEDISELINNLEILAFEELEEGSFTYTYRSAATNTDPESNKYTVTLRLSEVAVKLLLIANHTNFENIVFGCPIEEVAEHLLPSFTPQGITSIPMYGEISFPDGLTIEETGKEKNIPLLRSVAAVEISLGSSLTDNKFLLKSAQAYRANNLIQVIPNSSVFVQESNQKSKVTGPSVPQAARNTITTQMVTASDEPVQKLDRFYLPESEAQATAEATCLIIGGIYCGDNPTNTEITYYRIDFKDENQQPNGQILRNYLYSIEITNVTGPGTTHPDDADEQNIQTIIYDWGDSEHKVEL
ncbi:MAG: hypothetical protein LUH10_05890 [Tannerellaceae bacterium]|nr:hypothetical protein [Tannerellaceae bacterium]